MLIENRELIPQLRARIESQIKFVTQEIETIPTDSLNFRPHKGSWSVLECIEHLNMVFDWYMPLMLTKTAAPLKPGSSYQSGFFGDRMVTSMEPQDGAIKFPMKTFRNMKPERSKRDKREIVSKFKDYMDQFDRIISSNAQSDLASVRIKSAIGNILRFKLGDCFRFLLAHNERHLLQCRKVLKVLSTYQ